METTVGNVRTDEPKEGDIYVGRPSKWGNPFRSGIREDDISYYEAWIMNQPRLLDALDELRGHRLMCHCHPLPCHADILARMADDRLDEK